ncbi:YceD family protein [Roseomonas sp. E05]|uniref:YceD family protein n=1 Tax=Roseomonas sp. E05 TaxID=3046310 RepID=UPI0024B91B68|nr:YceD family protein [Roseomonas sp. E05]MDJ0389449.1 YceD family protein [Roseomonas sp. E05]
MTIAPEFSRTLPWAAVGQEGRRQSLQATPAECAALARRFGIPAIEAFSAELELRPEGDEAIRVRGHLSARVVQSCVVTLEPVAQSVEEAVDLRFLAAGEEPSEDPEGPDEIPAERDLLELGEALAEQLALALDPYPRAPGAELPLEVREEEEEPLRRNPFSVLKGGKA